MEGAVLCIFFNSAAHGLTEKRTAVSDNSNPTTRVAPSLARVTRSYPRLHASNQSKKEQETVYGVLQCCLAPGHTDKMQYFSSVSRSACR